MLPPAPRRLAEITSVLTQNGPGRAQKACQADPSVCVVIYACRLIRRVPALLSAVLVSVHSHRHVHRSQHVQPAHVSCLVWRVPPGGCMMLALSDTLLLFVVISACTQG